MIIVIVTERLNLTSFAITRPFKHIKSLICQKMSIFVHVTHRPIRQLTVVNDGSADFRTVAERERAAREGFSFDAFNFAFTDGANSQRVSHDGVEKSFRVDRSNKAF
jgi:hypothetical protein